MKSIRDMELSEKKVFLRVDWNVPLKNGIITDDNRILATIPTIKYLVNHGSMVIIGTHLGRPDGEIIPSLSTKILAQRFSALAKLPVSATDFVIESSVNKHISNMKKGQILVLGNLRWHPEEENNNAAFSKLLSGYVDFYVNDAFSVCHRAHASVESITHFLPSYAGFLLEREVLMLSELSKSPRHPMVLVLGGAKINDKIGLIRNFINRADKILIGGAIANTIKYFQGEDVGASKVDVSSEHFVEEILSFPKDKIVLPVDSKREILSDGRFSNLDIGPKSIDNFIEVIKHAKTVFWNGNMGMSEKVGFEQGTGKIADAIANNNNITIVAGGDTVGFISSKGLLSKYRFVSTGGGASLEFLAGKKLPGLVALGYYDSNNI